MFSRFDRVTNAFFIVAAVTAVIWILRGVSLLSFLPGGILWVLILLTAGLATFNLLRWTE
jgi:hypothetical protein